MSNLITESVSEVESWNLPVIGGKIKHKAPSAKDLELIRQQAYKEGFIGGKNAGIQAGQEEIAKQVSYLQQILQSMESPLESFDEQLSHEVAELSIAIAKQIIRRELRQEPGQVVAIAREALTQLPNSAQNITITLHPEDAALLREYIPESSEQEYRIIENGAIQRGGCEVESTNSRIDASVEKQINSVVASLFGEERQTELNAEEQSLMNGEVEHGTDAS